ncbi:hypothetical protein IV203_007644 [Nitzschia inconspicua]|uniref:Uncharacterized protein n=1 Tax=Nitzschia inconspicua TaxID=303405 RepID=A0A9K3PDD9_9STRA|nr:hypothetical protein IV203_007644 [Nitzschia inconspicua]
MPPYSEYSKSSSSPVDEVVIATFAVSQKGTMEEEDESTCSTTIDKRPSFSSTDSRTSRGSSSKRVSFHEDLCIVEFPYVVGDNPCCSSGAPLSMDWKHQQKVTVSLEEFDTERHPQRRSKKDLALSASERHHRLLNSGCSRDDIVRADRQRRKCRRQRQATKDALELDDTIQMFVTLASRTKRIPSLQIVTCHITSHTKSWDETSNHSISPPPSLSYTTIFHITVMLSTTSSPSPLLSSFGKSLIHGLVRVCCDAGTTILAFTAEPTRTKTTLKSHDAQTRIGTANNTTIESSNLAITTTTNNGTLPWIESFLDANLLKYTMSFLSLEEVWERRTVSRAFLHACNTDMRWIPIIAPPSAFRDQEVLSLDKHGKALRWLYLTQYLPWLEQWQSSDAYHQVNRQHVVDGYFSLAPWRHMESDVTSYPNPWLHRIVHETACPTTLNTTALTAFPNSKRARPCMLRSLRNDDDDESEEERHCKRLKRDWKMLKVSDRRSNFFHRRHDGDYDGDDSSIHVTSIILPDYHQHHDNNNLYGPPLIIIQPVNLRMRNGKKHDRLPDLFMTELDFMNTASQELLACYFGGTNIHIEALVNHSTSLFYGRHGTMRKDPHDTPERDRRGFQTGRTVIQVAAEALKGATLPLNRLMMRHSEDKPNNNPLVVHVIAPHLFQSCYPRTEWVYNSYLSNNNNNNNNRSSRKDSATVRVSECVLSMFQVWEQRHTSLSKRTFLYCSLLLGVALHHVGLDYCENLHCAMNNMNSVEETIEESTLIVCPSCLCKLQLHKVVDDVPTFLKRLYELLAKGDTFREESRRDVARLNQLGVRSLYSSY